MRLTTIGTGTAAPAARRVCSGYLVESGECRLLLDCGSAVLHRMATLAVNWVGISDIAITHFHADHIGDLAPYIIAARYGTLPPRSAPLRVIGPPGIRTVLDRFGELFGTIVTDPGFPLEIAELAPGDGLALEDGVRLEARTVPHTDESVAYSVEQGGRRLVYSGDTAFDEGLADWARGCDLLLLECSLPEAIATPNHLTPQQCALLAARAGPGMLVLTHFYPPVEEVDIRGIVGERFGGRIVLAEDGWSTEVGKD